MSHIPPQLKQTGIEELLVDVLAVHPDVDAVAAVLVVSFGGLN